MIRIRVELMSAITGQTTELARMDIANDGIASSNNGNVGDYICRTYKGRSAEALDQAQVQRTGKIAGWRRHDFHVWNLVSLALLRMGYTQGHPATREVV
jgi:hypothetical protein